MLDYSTLSPEFREYMKKNQTKFNSFIRNYYNPENETYIVPKLALRTDELWKSIPGTTINGKDHHIAANKNALYFLKYNIAKIRNSENLILSKS